MTCLIHAIILSNDKLVMAKSSIANLRQSSIPVQEFKEKFLKQEVNIPSNIDHVHILSFNPIHIGGGQICPPKPKIRNQLFRG